eukprot:TRINITY_DN47138_c0_g1_i1.p1 TRINITY_DN47138_c0_g1~~TRINITY_DN47138_c0_g1_i1.p1  ORF type:complete len:499 (+),score=132.48 TRINITY_DN47138_c0_g1_i1:33-1499(+)
MVGTQYNLQENMITPSTSPERGERCASPKEGRRGLTKIGRRGEEEAQSVLVSFSGGLVGVCLVKWLLNEGYDVAILVADLGQHNLDSVVALADSLGASRVYVEDLKREFLTDFVIPSLCANCAYEGRDLLGTALSRFVSAKRQVQIAEKEGYAYVSHGCSAAGNDQCRFELTYAALYPQVKVISPFRYPAFKEIAKSRDSMLEWCQANSADIQGVSVSADHSEDTNIYSSCSWGGVLNDPTQQAPPSAWISTADPMSCTKQAQSCTLKFTNGIPTAVSIDGGEEITDIIKMFEVLGGVGRDHGIGRCDIVDNKFIGVKCRRVLECPAGEILLAAHADIEAACMDREVMRIRDVFTPKFSELVYNGFWFSPEMDFIQAAIAKSQEVITGSVTLRLFKGTATPISRNTPFAPPVVSTVVPRDIEGYIKVQAQRLQGHAHVMDAFQAQQQDTEGKAKKQTAWKEETPSSSYVQYRKGAEASFSPLGPPLNK